MKRAKYIVGIIVVLLCIIGTAKLLQPRVQQLVDNNEKKKEYQETQKKIESVNVDTEQGVWNKILMRCTNGVTGVSLHSLGDVGENTGYEMKVKSVHVTKEWNNKWDKISPDSYMKGWGTVNKGKLSNKYSYLVFDIDVNHKKKESLDIDFDIGNFTVGIFSNKGNNLKNYEVETANLGKNMNKNPEYYSYPIKVGNSKEIQIVYICKDKDILGNNYCILDMGLSGVASKSADGFCIYRLPSLKEYTAINRGE